MTNSQYRWVIVAAGGLLGCVAIGAMFSLPVFLRSITRDTGWSVTGVSSAMTIGFLALALTSMALGQPVGSLRASLSVVADRVDHPRVISLALASQATSLIAFQLIFGLFGRREHRGDFPADDGVRHRLVRHASQPCGVARVRRHGDGADDHVAAGGVARLDLRLANLDADHRRRCRGRDDPGLASGAPSAGPRKRRRAWPSAGGADAAMSVGQALKSPQFIILLLTNFFCCATHSGPIIHTVNYAVSCGIPLIAAVSIYSVEGFAGLGGRIAFGLLGDRFGAKQVLVLACWHRRSGRSDTLVARDLGDVLRGRSRVRLHLCRHHAALCRRSRARTFRCG